ncbi:MAG: IS630 family transposase [Thermomicrobiales bacterium]
MWDCRELARQVVADGVVTAISAETVRRLLARLDLKPWRFHYWLTPKAPRDAAFYATVEDLCDLYTRALAPGEVVLSVDEKTSLQPRPRPPPTRAPRAKTPALVEHEYRRAGALNLFAAFDTRCGRVDGQGHRRKRAVEFVAFLEHLDAQIGPEVTRIHLVLDNLRTHKTKAVQAWLAAHPRFVLHFTPVHCSWLNQIEQWFGLLQRKRLTIADFASLDDLQRKLRDFIAEWNQHAHPFRWTTASFAKVLAGRPAVLPPVPLVVPEAASALPVAA